LENFVPDALYSAIEKQAASEGVKPEAVAMRVIEKQFPEAGTREVNRSEAARAFRAMFGTARLGHAVGLDNEQLDAELAMRFGPGADDAEGPRLHAGAASRLDNWPSPVAPS
jgi:hypothetical protein